MGCGAARGDLVDRQTPAESITVVAVIALIEGFTLVAQPFSRPGGRVQAKRDEAYRGARSVFVARGCGDITGTGTGTGINIPSASCLV